MPVARARKYEFAHGSERGLSGDVGAEEIGERRIGNLRQTAHKLRAVAKGHVERDGPDISLAGKLRSNVPPRSAKRRERRAVMCQNGMLFHVERQRRSRWRNRAQYISPAIY